MATSWSGSWPGYQSGVVMRSYSSIRSVALGEFASTPLSRREQRSLAVAGLIEVFKKTWLDSWGPIVEHLLQNTLVSLLEQPKPILGDRRLLHDPS
jgi:hypothetical protein